MTDARLVVVTGAGGALGSQIAQELMIAGNDVVAVDRSHQALEAASAAWQGAGHTAFDIVVADQTSREDVERAFDAAVSRFGPLAGVVANAGYAKFGTFLDMPATDFERHVAVNLTGTFHVCQVGAQHLARQRTGGWMTVVASGLGLYHSDQVSAYCTTKAALIPMVRSAAAELGVHRIRVNAILPGVIETNMTHGMLDEAGIREGVVAKTPLGRLGSPKDIASCVNFLASSDAQWVTGAALSVDGGQSMYNQPTWITQDRSIEHEPSWIPGYSTT